MYCLLFIHLRNICRWRKPDENSWRTIIFSYFPCLKQTTTTTIQFIEQVISKQAFYCNILFMPIVTYMLHTWMIYRALYHRSLLAFYSFLLHFFYVYFSYNRHSCLWCTVRLEGRKKIYIFLRTCNELSTLTNMYKIRRNSE